MSSSLELALRRVASYFDASLSLEHIEDLLDSTSGAEPADSQAIDALAIVRSARTQPAVLNDLLELCNECTSTGVARRGETPTLMPISPSPSDRPTAPPIGWKHLISTGAIAEPDHLLAYFTCLLQLRPADRVNRRLGLMAARTYMLLLTVPGSQVYGLFHAPLVQRALGQFALLAQLLKAGDGGAPTLRVDHERIELLMNCVALQEDCKKMLQVVSLAEHDDLKRALVRSLNGVMLHYFEHVHRSKYSLQLYEQCFSIFDIICHPRHGDITDTLFAVLRGTGRLKRFTGKVHACNGTSARPTYETLSAWFAEKLSTLPSQAATVLTHYVKAILSNCALSAGGGPDVLQSNLDICVQYETALWRRGNTALCEYVVEELAVFADIGQRTHAVEFAVRLLAVEAPMAGDGREQRELEWSREVALLRLVLEKMLDVSNSVKIKAMAGFVRLAAAGNRRVKEILKQVFMGGAGSGATVANAPTVDVSLSEQFRAICVFRPESPTNSTTQTIKGIEQLHEYRHRLLLITRHNLANSSALVRKAAVLLLEFMSQTDIVLDEFLLSREMRALHADISPMVRRQLILTADHILTERLHSAAVVEAYVRLTLDLAADDDPKVADTVAESFKRNLFDNIRPANVTTDTERALLPWRLLRVMQSGKDVPDIRACIGGWVHKKLITRAILEHIVSHTQSDRALEAWSLLSMVASHITSREPGFVVEQLWKNIQTNDPLAIDIVYSQLEVLACWLDALDRTAQSEVLRIFDDLLGDGCVAPRNVQRTFEICARIQRKRTGGKDSADSGAHDAWAETVRQRCLALIRPNMRSLLIAHVYDAQLISCVHVYAEAVTALPEARPDAEVNAFLLDFLRLVTSKRIKFSSDSMLTDKMNAVQIVLTKLSLFDYELCLETVPVLGTVLNSVKQPDVIITAIACLGDLYKKRTSLAETVLPLMLTKTRHLDFAVRFAALQNITGLVIDEFIKFRGSLLIFVLAALLDDRAECSELAAELLFKYRAEKNPVLMRSCLLECPFVLNGYMHLDNMDMFSRAESSLRSPIAGAQHRPGRQYVYRFLVHGVDVLYCYLYFGNVVLVIDKLKSQRQHMERPEGLAAVRDFLFVLTHICRAKEKSKRKIGDVAAAVAGNDDDADDADELTGRLPAATSAAATNPAEAGGRTAGGAGGRGRRGPVGPTMEQALQVVEKVLPQIADLAQMLCTIDSTFAEDIDELGRAMCEHFVALTHYAQPQQFWNKYKVQEARPTASRPTDATTIVGRSKRTAGRSLSSSSSSSSSDDDGPPIAVPSTPAPLRLTPTARTPQRWDDDALRPESRASGRQSRASSVRKRR